MYCEPDTVSWRYQHRCRTVLPGATGAVVCTVSVSGAMWRLRSCRASSHAEDIRHDPSTTLSLRDRLPVSVYPRAADRPRPLSDMAIGKAELSEANDPCGGRHDLYPPLCRCL